MRSFGLSVVIALMTTAAVAADVPFAEPQPRGSNRADTSDLVSLGDIMSITQLRHIKLWYAGKSNDWELVGYEIDRITESLMRAALLYDNIPVEYIQAMGKPLADMREAAVAKDPGKFVRGYSEMTGACNGCHAAGRIGFVRIQEPTSSPFGDETFR